MLLFILLDVISPFLLQKYLLFPKCATKVLLFCDVFKKNGAQIKTCNCLIIKQLQFYPAHKC